MAFFSLSVLIQAKTGVNTTPTNFNYNLVCQSKLKDALLNLDNEEYTLKNNYNNYKLLNNNNQIKLCTKNCLSFPTLINVKPSIPSVTNCFF